MAKCAINALDLSGNLFTLREVKRIAEVMAINATNSPETTYDFSCCMLYIYIYILDYITNTEDLGNHGKIKLPNFNILMEWEAF